MLLFLLAVRFCLLIEIHAQLNGTRRRRRSHDARQQAAAAAAAAAVWEDAPGAATVR